MKKIIIGVIVLIVFYANQLSIMHVDMTSYEKDTIQVEVKGEVHKPGVYTLDKDATYKDALEASGGVTDKGDTSTMNLTNYLYDQDVIVVDEKQEDKKISINSASKDELETLPGIGPATADKILAYRNEYGSFQTLEDLMHVPGIKEKTYEKLKDAICL